MAPFLGMRDEFGDMIGGIGSSLAIDRSQWVKLVNGSNTGGW
jgi:hypothetical protein